MSLTEGSSAAMTVAQIATRNFARMAQVNDSAGTSVLLA
jgi:hypothetical protein